MVHLQNYIYDTHRINEWLAEWEDTANQMRELVQFVEDLEGLTEWAWVSNTTLLLMSLLMSSPLWVSGYSLSNLFRWIGPLFSCTGQFHSALQVRLLRPPPLSFWRIESLFNQLLCFHLSTPLWFSEYSLSKLSQWISSLFFFSCDGSWRFPKKVAFQVLLLVNAFSVVQKLVTKLHFRSIPRFSNSHIS